MLSLKRKTGGKSQKISKRKIKYIKKDFQRGFILKYCIIACLSMVLASILVYWLTSDTVTATYRYHRISLQPTSDVIAPTLVASYASVLLFLILATVHTTLYISHKIAGPLYRLEEDIKLIADGNLSIRIRLRQEDQLQDLATQINQLVDNLEKKMFLLQIKIDSLSECLNSPETNTFEIKNEIANLKAEIDQNFSIR